MAHTPGTFGKPRSLNELAQYFFDQLGFTKDPHRKIVLHSAALLALSAVSTLRADERRVDEEQWSAAIKVVRHASETLANMKVPEDAIPYAYIAGIELQDIVHSQFDPVL